MLDALTVVLFRPKFSENVGAAARACANMGVANLAVVDPRDFDPDRARALATGKGADILAGMRLTRTLGEALAGCDVTYGVTARTGGWRRVVGTPRGEAKTIVDSLASGSKAALVFGPEDAGLSNEEVRVLGKLLTIPAAPGASSLNLAQAVLVVLYEIFLAAGEMDSPRADSGQTATRPADHGEREVLFAAIQETLAAIDFLKPDNPGYFMLPVRRFFSKFALTRREFDMLMGICRQIRWIVSKTK